MNEVKVAILAEKVTRIAGESTRQDVEELQRELAEMAVKHSTGIVQGGDDYGHMFLVLAVEKYRTLIADNTYNHQTPVKPGAFDTMLTNVAGELLQKRRIKEHERKIEEYERYRGVFWPFPHMELRKTLR